MIEYAIIRTQRGILTYYTGKSWTNKWTEAKLFPNRSAATKSVISSIKDFNVKTFVNGRPAT